MNPKVNFYFDKAKNWQAEIIALRQIVLACGLTEELKWGKPCYMQGEYNIVLIQAFKEYCALLFFKGVLLPDPDGLLIQIGENTRVARQMRFSSVPHVMQSQDAIKAYIQQAIAIEEAGLKVDLETDSALVFPDEFQYRLDEQPDLKAAFEALTPGRQRAYNLYFSAPKQAKTRAARVEKCVAQILAGKGLNDN